MATYTLQDFHSSGPFNWGFTLPHDIAGYYFTLRAQVFTPSESYLLTRVGIPFSASTYPNSCTVAIFSTVGGIPSTLLTSGTVTISSGSWWDYVNFSQPVNVVAGTQYAIVSTSPAFGETEVPYDYGSYDYVAGRSLYWDANSAKWIDVWPSGFNYDIHFRTYSSEAAVTLENPTENGTGYYLNKDWLLEMRWNDPNGSSIDNHTVYFNGVPQNDRSRYSITAYKMYLGITLEYNTTYEWFVRKDLGGGEYIDSETWQFTTMDYVPPAHSTRTRPPYGGGDDIEVPTGENNIITVERLIAIADNKFFYEDV